MKASDFADPDDFRIMRALQTVKGMDPLWAQSLARGVEACLIRDLVAAEKHLWVKRLPR